MNDSQQPITSVTPSAGDVLQALFRTAHSLNRQFETRLISYDIPPELTGPRVRFLMAIAVAGSIRMSDLASKIGIQARTVTQFVDALEEARLLVRLPDPVDRRATLVQLTDSAHPILKKARASMAEVAEQILVDIPSDQRSALLIILNQLV
jgi:DNA-binding MarR family transcriptional regulator